MVWTFEARACVRCGQPIPHDKQSNACFYPLACKTAWGRARIRMRRAKELAAFEQKVAPYAKIAYYYRLAIRIKGQAWLYPTTQKSSPRFDGIERSTPGFLLDPFEPPVVPLATEYHLALTDANGRRVPIPKGEAEPILLVPCRPLNVEDGERGP